MCRTNGGARGAAGAERESPRAEPTWCAGGIEGRAAGVTDKPADEADADGPSPGDGAEGPREKGTAALPIAELWQKRTGGFPSGEAVDARFIDHTAEVGDAVTSDEIRRSGSASAPADENGGAEERESARKLSEGPVIQRGLPYGLPVHPTSGYNTVRPRRNRLDEVRRCRFPTIPPKRRSGHSAKRWDRLCGRDNAIEWAETTETASTLHPSRTGTANGCPDPSDHDRKPWDFRADRSVLPCR